MLDLAVMIEGQDGLTWPRWQRLAEAAEALGFAGLYRSDHFTNPNGPRTDALDLWASLAWLASHTHRIEFGPLVSPLSFRHPVPTAWTAAALNDLSNGRLRLGLGAGWQEREHRSFGFDLLGTDERFLRFAEGLEVVRALLRSDEPTTLHGAFFRLDDALLLPRPQRPGGPPIVIGGNGERRTLPLVARFADEWNGVFLTAERYRELNARLDALLDDAGRPRESVRRTLMTRVVLGHSEAEIHQKLGPTTPADARDRGLLVGAPVDLIEQMRELVAAGVQRVMLQWLDQDDLPGLETLARDVLPHL
ncbi:MAG: TIGR03560 family F420-dependent LLM class oxidoreductase [Chloroflexota bacterium]|nr:TIGR03560 family F420-dependent LLM class oxidoreductase [Chloroflexota bacterium]